MTTKDDVRRIKEEDVWPQEPQGDFSVRSSGSIGQEIQDDSGKTVAWTVDPELAHQIVRLLNSDE